MLTRDGGDAGFYFIGKAGALRVGRTMTVSHPVAEVFRARLLADD